jgi:leader peptidase (prepilin peptidase)/N-methyltransferase
MPLQKSVIWPGSRCGNCMQPIKWYDNIPIISYWRLGGKCRKCGVTFSSQYAWIEFLTGLVFAVFFYLEVVVNINRVGEVAGLPLRINPTMMLGIWLYHVVFVSLLIVATFVDIRHMEIPLSLTIFGTILGIVGGTLGPWPWPIPVTEPNGAPSYLMRIFTARELNFGGSIIQDIFTLPTGLQAWPFWTPDLEWFPPGSWQMGLATSLVGALVGTLLVRAIRVIFSWGLGKEAMGLGDADLLMMIGAFLGWQAIGFVLMFAVGLGLVYAIGLVLRNKGSELPFGPFLAGGAILTTLTASSLNATFQWLFFDLSLIVRLLALSGILAFLMTMAIRMMRLVARAA